MPINLKIWKCANLEIEFKPLDGFHLQISKLANFQIGIFAPCR